MMKPLVIFGATQMAELAHFYFTRDGGREVVAFTADSAYMPGTHFQGLPVVAFETVEAAFPPERFDMFVAVGYTDRNRLRRKKYDEARKKGYALASYVSSKADWWPEKTTIGGNVFIFEQNNIQPCVTIGDNVILWSANHIGHHSKVGDDCFIASHVVVSGNVNIGRGCFIGVNAALRDGIGIGEYSVIGAGCTVLADMPAHTICKAPENKTSAITRELRKI